MKKSYLYLILAILLIAASYPKGYTFVVYGDSRSNESIHQRIVSNILMH